MTLYETSLRAPMIVRAPGGKPGNVIRQPVEFLDIYPTLVSLAGLPAPTSGIGEVEGTDLAPLILSGQAVPASVVAGAAYSQVTRCRASYDNEIGPCSGEFGLKNASQFDWMGMSVRTATHRYVEWRNWSGDALAPVWAGAAVAIELYAHSAGDGGDFDSYVNGESVNIATDVASAPVVEALAAQIRTVFQPENIGVVAVPTAEAVLNAMAKVDSYFQASSDDKINGYPNNDWTGGVYMAGLMAHYHASKSASRRQQLLEYGVHWGDSHGWQLAGYRGCHGSLGCPDNICAGQAFAELSVQTSATHGQPNATMLAGVRNAIESAAQRACAVNTNRSQAKDSDECWWWVDALFMALPAYARVGALVDDDASAERIWDAARAQ